MHLIAPGAKYQTVIGWDKRFLVQYKTEMEGISEKRCVCDDFPCISARKEYLGVNKFSDFLCIAYEDFYYSQDEILEPSYACYIGIFLARGSKLLSNSKYMCYAQSIVDNLLGANILDSSHIRSIGYNHPQHHAFGQFFPSTPFIPGAVGIGYTTIDVYKHSAEYDMPCVGISMYLLSEIS